VSEDAKGSSAGTSRRNVMMLGLGAAAVAGVGGYYFLGGDTEAQSGKGNPLFAQLMEKGALPDHPVGDANAPVTIIEYSSMTCPHCANFHKTILPDLKKKYIETGKVRYIVREFPLNNLAVTAAMLTRCAAPEKYNPFVEAIYEKQSVWAFGEGLPEGEKKPLDQLFNIAKQVGMSKKSFDECLGDQALLDNIIKVRTRGNEVFKVQSTPTFFVNGTMVRGVSSLRQLEEAMEPFLKG